MRENCRSSGVATEDAIVSGLAPGKPACTEIVGKSTCGSGDTGRIRKATAPASAIATVSKVVATGRLMKISEIVMAYPGSGCAPGSNHPSVRFLAREAPRQTVEPQVNHRRRVQSQRLAENQSANHGDA